MFSQLKRKADAKLANGGIKEMGGPKVKSAAGRGKDPLVLECKSMSSSGLKAGGSGYAAPDYAVAMKGITKKISFQGSKGGKAKVVKIIHGVPVYFRDERAAMSASEIRAMKAREKVAAAKQL